MFPQKICIELPHHISAFWLPVNSRNPLKKGSIGAGFLVTPRSVACYPAEKFPFKIKPRQLNIIDRILNVDRIPFKYKDPLPPAVGYSVSATLSLSYSFVSYVHLGKSFTLGEVCRLSHIAEVKSNTGLGDISAICGGKGVVIRLFPGAPGFSVVDSLVTDVKKFAIVTSVLRRMKTKDMLRAYKGSLEIEGTKAFYDFLEDSSVEHLVQIAKEFSKRVGMMSEEIDDRLSGLLKGTGALGYFVKKGIIVVLTPVEEKKEIYAKLKSHFGNARIHSIDDSGLRIIYS
ncbi:MAG: hypothetical protein GU347_04855 [Desulfurococcales archaeon]|nr:hypothetical protein [Desulfurococcales archaeon]